MHQTHEKTEKKQTVTTPVFANFLPIAAQIHLKNMCKRHDKRRTRAKQKKSWKQDW